MKENSSPKYKSFNLYIKQNLFLILSSIIYESITTCIPVFRYVTPTHTKENITGKNTKAWKTLRLPGLKRERLRRERRIRICAATYGRRR